MGKRLKRLRVGNDMRISGPVHMSQAALAKRAGLTREYVNKIEAGKQDPSLTTISALAKALGVPVTELFS